MKRILFLLLAALLLAGCAADGLDPTPQSPTGATTQSGPLNISVTRLTDPALTSFTTDELGGSYSMTYHNVTDVQISIGTATYLLDHAIKDGRITIEALVAQAQFDAATGSCKESFTSTNGLTRFTYTYPDFELVVYDDVYESPSAEPHLFRELIVSTPGNSDGVAVSMFITGGNGEDIDIGREDWGITLEAADVTADGLTLRISQSGGQQAGTLNASYFTLTVKDGEEWKPVAGWDIELTPITADGTTAIQVDWTSQAGVLAPGEYYLSVMVNDQYDSEALHPLQKKYRDSQFYAIGFVIS